MKALIDHSLFQYQCIEFNKGDELFTYKTDEKIVKKINKELFDFFKQICDSDTILKDLFSKKNNHEIKNLAKRNFILRIFKNFGFKDEYVDQHIGDKSIYQYKTKEKRRFIFILETKTISKNEKIMIIKPLFLDINHVIYNDKRFQKNFQICLICWENNCIK